jgi:glycosyltransferase involved in cell wall biosynthesis
MKTVSIIMPALNEESNISEAIASVLACLDRLGIPGELIVVNDGSTDATGPRIEEWMRRDSRVRTLRHTTPHGIGSSFWEGVDYAVMDNVVMLPGDNENDPEEIFRYYNLLEHVDIVVPFLYNRNDRPLFRNILSMLYRQIVNTTFLVNFNYTNGTILYKRDILLDLPFRGQGFFFQTDVLVRLVRAGYLFAEVPYRIRKRKHGDSKAVSFPSLLQVIKGYLRLARDVNFRPPANAKSHSKDSLTSRRLAADSASDGKQEKRHG